MKRSIINRYLFVTQVVTRLITKSLPGIITKFLILLLIVLTQFFFVAPRIAYAASAPNLGVASSYSVFGDAGVTDAGGSSMWGDVGQNAAGDGSTAGEMTGTLYTIAQPTVVSAISVAYGDLAGEAQTGAIDLGASPTVGPGVYDVGATAFNSTLTLSGSGVYIFRSTESIAQTAGGTMLLTNGATSCNVYWQIPTSITFADSGNIVGSIITNTGDITFASGVNLVGRAWAHTSVTLDHNRITQPDCTAAAVAGSSLASAGPPPAPYCPPLSNQIVAPVVLQSERMSPTSISLSWGPYSGTNLFNVEYGFTNGSWLYNTDVTGFSVTLGSLPANQPIWVRIATRSDCTIGNYGQSKLVGGPGLPNTGFAPSDNNSQWYLPAGIFLGISIPLFLIQRKQTFSSGH